jgi:hypothetical protein
MTKERWAYIKRLRKDTSRYIWGEGTTDERRLGQVKGQIGSGLPSRNGYMGRGLSRRWIPAA